MAQENGKVAVLRPAGGDACATKGEPFRPLKFQAAWVETENEQRFLALMETIEAAAGTGCFGYLWDLAGRGKTDTSAQYTAKRKLPHIRVREDWKSSTLPFLKRLCVELGWETPQRNRTWCIDKVIELLHGRSARQRIIFIDEADRIARHLDLMRDLADLAGAAFILIGETGMPAVMEANRRLWSRTLGAVRFEAIEPQHIMAYGWESAELQIEPAAAQLWNQAVGGGDWRIIRNRVIKAVGLANAKKTRVITEDLARLILEGN